MNREKSTKASGKISKLSLKKASGLFRFLRPYSGYFILGFLFLILSSLTAMMFPYLLGKLIGQGGPFPADVSGTLEFENVNQIIKILLLVFIGQAVFSFFRIYLFAIVTEGTLSSLRETAFRQLISSPISFFNKNKVGELTSRVANDINQLQSTINTTLAEFVRQIITIVVGIIALTWLSPRLSIIMLSIIPLVALLAVFFGRFIRKLSREAQDSAARSNNILEEALTGIANVKAYTGEQFEIIKFGKTVKEIRSLSVKGAVWRGLFASFIIICMFGAIVFIIWQGVLMTRAGELGQGDFIAFIMYTIFLGASIGSLPDLYASIQKAIGATENLMAILEEKTENISPDPGTFNERLKGKIEFQNVSFNYETRKDIPVLNNVNFIVNPGEQIAIVGPSGAGKSTLASLLLRFYEPDSGKILIDGEDAKIFNLTSYRSHFAVVPQEVILFGGSIRENISYSKPNASDEEIREAAEKANAIEFIDRFPEGLDTIVGERGIQLSGGQRQRIAIARAVLRNPEVLILDEATSSLDSESEHLVQEALEELMKNRTSFVIAHRLSTIKKADKILVLENGVIAEAGTHKELMEKQEGLYKKLQAMQNLQVNA